MWCSAGPVPTGLRESREGWAECVTGALPEAEYLDLIAQAGFKNVAVRRSTTTGEISGVPIFSVIVSARKLSPDNQANECDCNG